MLGYVALLRGINVGGKNLIKMAALKACFEANAFEDVATYIQSGNVVFASPETRAAELTQRIEAILAETFGYQATVVVRKRDRCARSSSVRPMASVPSRCGTGMTSSS